jgi:hypothetical protein
MTGENMQLQCVYVCACARGGSFCASVSCGVLDVHLLMWVILKLCSEVFVHSNTGRGRNLIDVAAVTQDIYPSIHLTDSDFAVITQAACSPPKKSNVAPSSSVSLAL